MKQSTETLIHFFFLLAVYWILQLQKTLLDPVLVCLFKVIWQCDGQIGLLNVLSAKNSIDKPKVTCNQKQEFVWLIDWLIDWLIG